MRKRAPGPVARKRGRKPWRAYAVAGVLAVAMVAAYWLLPLDDLGPRRPVASWTVFVLTLALIAVLLVQQIRTILAGWPRGRPAIVIPLLLCLTVLVFSAGYLALAKQPGEMRGLHTRLDAVYFTLVSISTIGYGDIAPIGQYARLVTTVQILYTFVFLTAATTALSRFARDWLTERRGGSPRVPQRANGPEQAGGTDRPDARYNDDDHDHGNDDDQRDRPDT